jgi:hypothetical protein
MPSSATTGRRRAAVGMLAAVVLAAGAAVCSAARAAGPIAAGAFAGDTSALGGGGITLTLPSGVAGGEFLLGVIAIQGGGAASATITLPSGWSAIRDDACGSDLQESLAFRIAQAGDTSGSQFTWNFNGTFAGSGSITAYSNVDSATPVEAQSFRCSTSGVLATAPSITTTQSDSLDLALYGIVGDNFLSQPSGYALAYQHNIPGSGPFISSYFAAITSSGLATGDQTVSAATGGDAIGYQLLLAPPGLASPTPTATPAVSATPTASPTLGGTPNPTPTPAAPVVVSSTQEDSSSGGAGLLTLVLPSFVEENDFLVATIAAATAPNSDCTGPGVPFACCTEFGTGTCQDASTASIEVPAGWTEIRHDSCGSDLLMSLAYRIVQPGDSGSTQFTWNFLGAGQPSDSSSCTGYGAPSACCTGPETGTCPYSPLLASGGITLVANVSTVTPVEDNSELCTLNSTSMTAPSITTTEDNSLVLVAYGITSSNFFRAPSGYSEVYQHSIVGSGPDVANYAGSVFPTSGAASGDHAATASVPGDNIGYQVGLSPRLP